MLLANHKRTGDAMNVKRRRQPCQTVVTMLSAQTKQLTREDDLITSLGKISECC